MSKLSIIIPVYNTEQYIRQCLNSVLEQALRDLEIICINDGSTDNSLEILLEYAKTDERVKVYDQVHKGVSSARNLGLDKASGEYLLFLDSDDFLLRDKLKKIYKIVLKSNADIVVFSGTTTDIRHTELWLQECLSTRNKKYFLFSPDVFFKENGAKPVVWNKFFKRALLLKTKIRFSEDIGLGEDQLFDFCVIPHAGTIQFIRKKLYCYRVQRDFSAMEQYKKNPSQKAQQHLEIAKRIWENWERQDFFSDGQNQLLNYLIDFLYGTTMETTREFHYLENACQFLNRVTKDISKLPSAKKEKVLLLNSMLKMETTAETNFKGYSRLRNKIKNNIAYLFRYGVRGMYVKLLNRKNAKKHSGNQGETL